MADLHARNLARIAELARGRPVRSRRLQPLLDAALAGEGEVLRLSPQRTVLRIPTETGAFLLKICHPQRRGEGLRRLLSPPPATRELRRLLALATRGFPWPPHDAEAEQLRPELGLFARRFWEGRPATDANPADAHAAGAGIAELHALGWTDPDLLPGDLLLHGVQLLPLDLGHARLGAAPASPLAQRADLLRFLAAFPPGVAAALAPPLCAGHRERSALQLDEDALPAAVARVRRARLERQSARCLRSNRDFVAAPSGSRRRGWEWPAEAPGPLGEPPHAPHEVLAEGARTRVTRRGSSVEKLYRRRGPLQALRRFWPGPPARRTYRGLYRLELHGLPAARPLGWRRTVRGSALTSIFQPGPQPDPSRAGLVAAWLGRLHAAGLGLRDPKLANFVLGADASPTLVDGDGLRPRASSARRARELGRLLAEIPAGDEAEVTRTYLAACHERPGPARDEERLRERARRAARRYRATLLRKAGGAPAGPSAPGTG